MEVITEGLVVLKMQISSVNWELLVSHSNICDALLFSFVGILTSECVANTVEPELVAKAQDVLDDVTVPSAAPDIGKILLGVFSNPGRGWTVGLHQGKKKKAPPVFFPAKTILKSSLDSAGLLK
ncbi:small integral membrane protein 38 isoform X1 [Caloenas nicobarica]|uniref:small integral membrane protein 38 isoform X1 n=1 Tax=Caloenas nicobarica TaxID=187106 RepID=UPI0032B7BF04